MNVGVAYADTVNQIWMKLEVPDNSTVGDVIARSGVLERFPEIDLEVNKVGVFGSVARLNKPVKDGDRVEIYRPIHPEAEFLEKKDSRPNR